MIRYIGVDLHTNSFTACILQEGEQEIMHTLPLQNGGLERFIATLHPTDEVAIEATGNSNFFRREIVPHVKRVVIIAPWQFEVIRRSTKKTDKHDARAIAFFLSKNMLPEARKKDEHLEQIISLIATRDQLVKLRVTLINRIHAMFVRHGLKQKKEALTTKAGFERCIGEYEWNAIEQIEIDVIRAQLDTIRDQNKKLEKAIVQFAKELPGYENLISIKGVGPLSAAIMLTHIGDISDFKDNGKLASYFGITPRVSQSNDSQRVGRITKRGNKIARTALVQCTLIAKRYSPYLNQFYERIKIKRGTGKAIVATARKLLNTIFYTLKNGWIFDDFTKFTFKSCNQS